MKTFPPHKSNQSHWNARKFHIMYICQLNAIPSKLLRALSSCKNPSTTAANCGSARRHASLGPGSAAACLDKEPIFYSYIVTLSQKAQGASAVCGVVTESILSPSAPLSRLGLPGLF